MLIAIYLMLVVVGSGYVFLKLWPAAIGPPTTVGASENVTFLIVTVSISPELRMIGLVLAAGAFGAGTFGLWAEYRHIALKDFDRRWVLWYLARPFLGGFLGLTFYLALRAGLFSIGSPVSELNVFGFTAIAALVGMFQEETLTKLRQIAETMLAKATYLDEDFDSGESVPIDGVYAFIKHAEGSTCGLNHVGLAHTMRKGQRFPKATPCGEAAIWMRVGPSPK